MKFNVELGPEQEKALEEIAARVGVKKSDIVRRGISLLETIANEAAEGRRTSLLIEDPKEGGKTREMWLDLLLKP